MTSLDDILAAVGSLAETVGSLADTVGAQGEQIAALAAGAPVDAGPVDLSHIKFEQGNGAYAPLAAMQDHNKTRRVDLALLFGFNTKEASEVMLHGARGLYRQLSRPEDHEGPLLARHIAVSMVEDALAEDTLEAADMSADLLKIWDDVAAPELGKPHVIAGGAVT